MWGVSDDETNDPYTNAPPEEDEEVIESVLDHRKKETTTGKLEKYLCKIYIDVKKAYHYIYIYVHR